MPIDIARAHSALHFDPLTWFRGESGVDVKCGNGHISGPLENTHTINAGGNVSPSLVCSHGDCDWHEFVRLVDWARDKD